jgi:hypothetical protein
LGRNGRTQQAKSEKDGCIKMQPILVDTIKEEYSMDRTIISIVTLFIGLFVLTSMGQADCVTLDGPGGGEQSIDYSDICKVDGGGNWILWGIGQDLVIHDKKDGDGSLTLHNFGKITILGKKDGNGALVVEKDNKEIHINVVNGNGKTYLRNPGLKKISVKDGSGNVYFQGNPPFVGQKNGAGQIVRE